VTATVSFFVESVAVIDSTFALSSPELQAVNAAAVSKKKIFFITVGLSLKIKNQGTGKMS